MLSSNLISRPTLIASIVLPLALLAGCTKSADPSNGTNASTNATISADAAPPAKTPSKLGDISQFRKITDDVMTLVNKGDLEAAKARIKDLEVAWDEAEAGLKPRAAEDWHTLDKAIDGALSALRANPANYADAKAAMSTLLQAFDKLQGR